MKLVHWPLMGGLLHLVQRGGDCAGPQPAQVPPRCTNVTAHSSTASVPVTVLLYNGPLLCGFNVPIKGLQILVSHSVSLQPIEIERSNRIGRWTLPGNRSVPSRASVIRYRLYIVLRRQIHWETQTPSVDNSQCRYWFTSVSTLWVKKWTLFHLSITFANTVRF